MGLNDRLVITPLTERFYLTVAQALSLHLNVCVAGPTGTGKTETVRDLAKALAIYCLVTKCSDAIDHRTAGRIFSGLCQTGTWGCFDDFNHIEMSVLSVISTQLQLIRTARFEAVRKFTFEGEEINFSRRVSIFITISSDCAGYTELPESLKAQSKLRF